MRAFAILAFVCSVNAAEFKSGNALLNEMNHDHAVFQMVAMGYVQGISDAGDGINHCLPANVQAGQLRDLVKSYLIDNPGNRHFLASVLVGHVLKITFPCKKGSSV